MTTNKHVRKYLDLGTGNLNTTDVVLLDRSVDERDEINMVVPLVRKYEYGWWVWVPDAEDMEFYFGSYSSYGFTPSFIAALRYARENNCDWINFDRDAEPCEDLQIFDW